MFLARIVLTMALIAAPALASGPEGAAVREQKRPIQVTWLGHSAFEIVSSGGTQLLIDPFIKDNPRTPEAFKNLSRYKPSAILVTHNHGDHLGDAVELAKLHKVPVMGSVDFVWTLGLNDVLDCNVGGQVTVGDITIHAVPAVHGSSPDGRPMGYVLTFGDGRSLYHSGDTWITMDMAFIQHLYRPDILLMCAGGGPYTQDPATAALEASMFFTPSVVVPMHYGTWPILATEQDVRDAFKHNRHLVIMTPGETRSF